MAQLPHGDLPKAWLLTQCLPDHLGPDIRVSRFSRKRGCSPRWPFCLGDLDKNCLKYLSKD